MVDLNPAFERCDGFSLVSPKRLGGKTGIWNDYMRFLDG